MKVRILTALTATAAVWAGAHAQEPSKLKLKPTLPAAAAAKAETKADTGDQVMNQSLADQIATKLDGNGVMAGADVQVFTSNGTVTLVGTAKSDKQKQDILDVVRYVGGVKQVRDGLKVQPVKQVQGVGPLATPAPSGLPPMPMGAGAGGGYGPDSVPVGPAGGPGGFEGSAPPLPPHAWPTYAPYNNVSRVAYPEAYPYNAFPFIGPFYPFPKVPLGWRKVTLEWEDGHWWLGRKQAPIDYWRVRFGN